MEDLELHLQSNLDSGLYFEDMLLILLLFADDMAILGKTPEDLQIAKIVYMIIVTVGVLR